MVDLPVSVFGLADSTVGQGVAGVVGVHAKVEVMAGVGHGELGGAKVSQLETSKGPERKTNSSTSNHSLILPKSDET